MEVQLEEEYEDKQKVLRDKRELECKLLNTQEQVTSLRSPFFRFSGGGVKWAPHRLIWRRFGVQRGVTGFEGDVTKAALSFRWARGMWRQRRG